MTANNPADESTMTAVLTWYTPTQKFNFTAPKVELNIVETRLKFHYNTTEYSAYYYSVADAGHNENGGGEGGTGGERTNVPRTNRVPGNL